MDGWRLFLKKVKSSELSSLYYILAECFPVRIDEGKVFVWARKEFFRSVIESHKEAVNEMFEKVTGYTLEITTTQGKRIQVPVKKEETEIQVNAVLRRIIFRKEDFYILYFESENSDFTAKGYLPTEPVLNAEYVVYGKWEVHPKYGKQLNMFHVEPVVGDDLVKFLSSGIIKGIKKATAERIVEKFGEKTMDILNNDIERLLEVKGIGRKTLAVIRKSYEKNRNVREAVMFFSKFDIPISQIFRMFKLYGTDVIKVVSENPYRLITDVRGIGFKRADKIARKLGIEKTDSNRIRAGVVFTMQEAVSFGNVFLPEELLVNRSASALQIGTNRIMPILEDEELFVKENGNVYFKHLFECEEDTAKHLLRIRKEARPMKFTLISDISLSPEQKKCVENVFKHGVSVITGFPGTGKTTVIRSIVESAEKSGYSVVLASPTGKAAIRMEEVSGHKASTIHRLLGLPNEINEISADVIIIDESSMLDIEIASYLLSAVKNKSHIVFVGDVDQLPSVSPGKFLSDVVGIFPTVYLRKVFRQGEGSGIALNAKRINEGKFIKQFKDFIFVKRNTDEEIVEYVINLVTKQPNLQVLSPARKGRLGIRNLNSLIQQFLNPFPEKCMEFALRKFCVGDKVMQIVNDYDKGVFNGEVGYVIDADDDTVKVRFLSSGNIVEYKREETDEIELAYASTVHKFQGSETNEVAITLHSSHSILLQRRLLYTAVTRAKKKVIIVGEEKALRRAIANNVSVKRYTALRRKIQNGGV